MKNNNEISTFGALIITFAILIIIGGLVSATKEKCAYSGCDHEPRDGSNYCYLHGTRTYSYGRTRKYYSGSTSTGSSGNSSNSETTRSTNSVTRKYYSTGKKYQDSYDDGYNDIYEDDDYDQDRYYRDDEYALGVDDAMDDEDW